MAIARESQERVVGLSIVMPTTKQWSKVEAGLGFGNLNKCAPFKYPKLTELTFSLRRKCTFIPNFLFAVDLIVCKEQVYRSILI